MNIIDRSIEKTFRTISIFLFLVPSIASCQKRDDLDKKIGQMILIGFPGKEVDPMLLKDIKAGKAGAIIYFEKNLPVANTYQAVKKMNEVYQKASPIPLLVCIDQEGGKVNRLKTKYGFPKSVSAAYIGRTKSLDTARYYANTTSATLAGIGFNVNFAPCVDLAVTPENTVIVKAERSYSRNADSVARFASEVVKQHRKYNVLTALKHFPGHGSSAADTHFGVADVTGTWIEDELKPYRIMLASGFVDAVMTSHIVNKKLDPKGLPGTLSKNIIDSLLRKKMGFNGVIFTDDMQMQAIAKNFTLEEMIKLAINAGVDIMCFSNNIAGSEERAVDKVHRIIKTMVETGEIKRERIEESYKRIMVMKGKLGGRTR